MLMNEPIRILQYVRVLDNGGIEKLIFDLLDSTNRERVAYDFLLLRNQEEAYEEQIKKYNSKKIIVIPKKGRFFPIKCWNIYKALYKYFQECEYTIIHFQSIGNSFGGSLALLAAKNAGIPIRIVHGHSASGEARNFLRKIDAALGRKTHMMWGTNFIACSKMAAIYSFGKKNLDKVKILNNGIHPEKFSFNLDFRNEVRDELGISNNFVLGSISRLSPPKNHHFMIDILEETLKIRPDAVLLIVGSFSTCNDGYLDSIKDYIDKKNLLKKVIFAGERKDAYRVINAIDAYLFPSLWEGLGIAAVEAQANGLNVFASDYVPEEAHITNNYHVISLRDNAKKWAETICKAQYNIPRLDCSGKVSEAGYNIRLSAKQMEEYYEKLNVEKSIQG